MHLANVTVPGPGPDPVWADAIGPPLDPHAARANVAAPTAGANSNLTPCTRVVVRSAV
jgi:hypothetical protein